MGFFIFLLLCNLLIPIAMIGGGYWMYHTPPKSINGLLGYRTKRSKLSRETWIFAHKHCGKNWIRFGIGLLILSIAVQLPFVSADEDTVGILTIILETVQIAVMLLCILPTEKALKEQFDDRGNPIEK